MSSDDAESRYSSQYEERLDPFSSFSKKERQRKYMNLKPYDKITLGMVSLFFTLCFSLSIVSFNHLVFCAVIQTKQWHHSEENQYHSDEKRNKQKRRNKQTNKQNNNKQKQHTVKK